MCSIVPNRRPASVPRQAWKLRIESTPRSLPPRPAREVSSPSPLQSEQDIRSATSQPCGFVPRIRPCDRGWHMTARLVSKAPWVTRGRTRLEDDQNVRAKLHRLTASRQDDEPPHRLHGRDAARRNRGPTTERRQWSRLQQNERLGRILPCCR